MWYQGSGWKAICPRQVFTEASVVVCVNGYFGERMCDMTQRCGGELIRLDVE